MTGAIVLSGDAARFDNFVNARVPALNFNADASRKSMDRIAGDPEFRARAAVDQPRFEADRGDIAPTEIP